MVAPGTFITDYHHPQFRVLFNEARDANPFFHLLEAMWMLAGRQDLEFVAAFASNMRTFSADGKTLQAAYGWRWRNHFDIQKIEQPEGTHQVDRDQLGYVVRKLVEKPGSRQVVLTMWDPTTDLVDTEENAKDRACNLSVVFTPRPNMVEGQLFGYRLDMTVYNRSNDLVWGAYGANQVHFGFLHEVVATAACMTQGTYTQIGANTHLYTEDLYGKKLYAAIHSADFNRLAVSESILVLGGPPALRVSAHNLYLADQPALALHHWGWGLNSFARGSEPGLWADEVDSSTTVEYRMSIANDVLYGVGRINDLLEKFLSVRRDHDEGTNKGLLERLWEESKSRYSQSMNGMPVFVQLVVIPMFVAHEYHRRGETNKSTALLWDADRRVLAFAEDHGLSLLSLKEKLLSFHGVNPNRTGLRLDWFIAGQQWLDRRNSGKARSLPVGGVSNGNSTNEWTG